MTDDGLEAKTGGAEPTVLAERRKVIFDGVPDTEVEEACVRFSDGRAFSVTRRVSESVLSDDVLLLEHFEPDLSCHAGLGYGADGIPRRLVCKKSAYREGCQTADAEEDGS